MRRWLTLCFLGLALAGGATGCKTTDPDDDISARPWNEQRTWETGLPSGIYERR